VAHTLHFKPILDPPLKILLGEPPFPSGCMLARLEHSIARVKISAHSTPKGPKYVLPNKSTFRIQLHL